MNYDVKLSSQAQKDLDSFKGKQLVKFEKIIMDLYDNPRPNSAKKLRGGGSRWRIRAGDYRILCEIDNDSRVVKIYRIAHRKDVYR